MRHRTKFREDWSKRSGDMADFRFFKMAAAAMLFFKKLEILTAYTLLKAKMHHHAKFCADRSRRCRDMAVFDFSRWRLSAILDF